MSLAQRVLLTWLFTLLFLIMLVLKLDEKAPWNWFLIFIPVWIFDTILLVMLIVKMAGRCKSGFDPRHGSHNIKKKAWYLVAMLLKLAFCLALCAKLEQFTTMNLSYVFIPLWALLAGALIELGYNVFFVRDWFLRTSSHIVVQQTIIKAFWILASLKNTRKLRKIPNVVLYCFCKIVLANHQLLVNSKQLFSIWFISCYPYLNKVCFGP